MNFAFVRISVPALMLCYFFNMQPNDSLPAPIFSQLAAVSHAVTNAI